MGVGAGAAATALPGCAPDISPAPVMDAQKDSNGRVWLEVARYPNLAREGGAVTLRVPGEQPLLVVHPGGSEYAVMSSRCTHSGCPLGFERNEVVCPCHGSRFALDGTAKNPPAKAPLSTVVSRFDPDKGLLLIDFKAGDEDFPALVDGKLFFPFSRYPGLGTPGGRVQGIPEGHGKLLFVFALEDGTYAAVDSTCTHQGCPVSFDEEARDLMCGCHESRFTKTGTVTEGPALVTGDLQKFTATRIDSGVLVTVA
jgi:Rieske Fe-S protein